MLELFPELPNFDGDADEMFQYNIMSDIAFGRFDMREWVFPDAWDRFKDDSNTLFYSFHGSFGGLCEDVM